MSQDEPLPNFPHETQMISVNIADDDSEPTNRGYFQTPNSRGQNSKLVSDGEAAEMGQVLQDMRSLALGIQEEQDRQLQQLDLLSDSVDKANERIRADSRKVNKLV